MLFTTKGLIVIGALCVYRLVIEFLKAWKDADDSIKTEELAE